jgi:hypothetical protein
MLQHLLLVMVEQVHQIQFQDLQLHMLEEEVEEHIKVELLDLEEQVAVVVVELEEHVIQEQQEQLTLEEVVEVDQFNQILLVDQAD